MGSLIAVIISNPNYIDKYSDIKKHKIKDLNYAFFSSEKYMKKIDKTINIEQIKDKNFVINKNTTILNKFHIKHKLHDFINVSSNSFITDFIKSGIGIGLVIKEFAESVDGIYEIKIKEELPKAELVILINSNKYHNIAISYFINGLIGK